MTLDPSLDRTPEALVIDTHTRYLPADEAYRRVLHIAEAARDVPRLYKKTDSTLRGNIPAEFDALRSAFPDRAIVYVPAYPAVGRTVVSGVLHAEGRATSILRLLGDTATLATPATLAESLRPGAVVVCDGACEADLATAAAGIQECDCIAAGPAAFARYWLGGRADFTGPLGTRPARVLLVNGSLHPNSRRQVREFNPPPNWTVLSTPDAPAGPPELVAARQAVEAAGQPAGCLIIFGGETTRAVLEALRVTTVQPCGELLPGVPVSVFRGITLITKAGAFGPPGVLNSIRKYLE